MATVDKTVEVIFAGVDQMSGAITSITGGLGKLDSAVQAVAAPLAKVADAVLAADAALAVLAVGGLALSVKTAGEFTDGITEVATLTSATGVEIEAFSQDVLDYSRTSTASIGDINKALYNAVSAGIDYKNSIDFLTAAEKLATAGKADLSDTTLALASTMNAYGAKTDEAGRYSGAFFTIVKDGLTTMPQLASSMSTVTSVAALAKVPIEQVGAAMAALTAFGFDTSTAATVLANVIKGIIDPSNQAAAAAKSMGLEFTSTNLAASGLDGVMRQVQDATGGNIDKMKLLFDNVRSFRGAAVLATDSAGIFARTLDDMGNAVENLERGYKLMTDTFQAYNQNLINNLQATLAQVGIPLLKEYGDATKAISAVSAAVGISIDQGSFDVLFAYLEQASGDFTALLNGIATALPDAFASVDWAPIIDALDSMRDEFGKLFQGLDLTNVKDLGTAIQFTVDTIGLLLNVTSGMIPEFGKVIDAGIALLKRFQDMDAETQQAIGGWLAIAKLITSLGTTIGGLAAFFSPGGSVIPDMTDQYDIYVGDTQKAIQASLALETQIRLLGNAARDIPDPMGDASNAIKTVAQQIKDAEQAGKDMTAAQKEMVINAQVTRVAWSGLADAQKELEISAQTTRTAWTNLDGSLQDTAAHAKEYVTATGNLSDGLKKVDDNASETAIRITALGKTAQAAQAGLGDLYQGADGLWRLLPDLGNATQNAAGTFISLGDTTLKLEGGFTELYKGADGLWHVLPQLDGAMAGVGQSAQTTRGALDGLSGSTSKTAGNIEELYLSASTGATRFGDLYKGANDVWYELPKVGDAAKKAAADIKSTSDAFKIGANDSEDFRLKIAQLKTDIATTALKLDIDLQIAKVKADADVLTAMFDSIGQSVASVSSTVSGLFGQLGGAMSSGNILLQNSIQQALQQQLALQYQLVQAQIDAIRAQTAAMQARTQALASGQALIKIDGSNLSPALQLVMWNIIEEVQVAVNQNAADFLLGIP